MININLAKNALAVALQLKENGIQLAARDNSILADLADASVPYSFSKPGAGDVTVMPGGRVMPASGMTFNASNTIDEHAWSLEYATANDHETSTHTLRITSLADDLAPIVTSHIYTARSVVIPLVMKFEEDAARYLELAKAIDPASEFKIITHRIPALLGDEAFNAMGLDSIVNLTEIRDAQRRLSVKLDDVDQAVIEICNLGNDRLNGLLGDWLEYAPADLIKNTLLANFTSSQTLASDGEFDYAQYLFDQYSLRRGNQGHSMHVSLATWLIASWLLNNVKPTEENVRLEEYHASFQYFIDAAGVTLKASLDMMGRQIESGVMVMSLLPARKEITVHDLVYRTYLENGGKPEAVLGMLVSNRSFFDSTVVLENQASLIDSWNNYVGFRQTKDITDIRMNFQGWVRSYMAIAITEQAEIEKEYEKTNPGLKDAIMKEVDKEIMHLSHRLHEDIGHTALHMVAKARFFYTSAYTLLSEMQQVARVNKDIDPREAATAAVITYLVEYLYSQVNITSLLK